MRTSNSIKNFFTTILPYAIITFLGFWKVRAFITNLGNDIYSVNQVFYQIFTYLSLAEAGIGIIAVQKYYKLLVENNKDEINQVYSASKIFLKKVAFLMLGIGAIVSFFLKFLTKNDLSLGYLQLVFMLFLVRNLVDYFMFSPRFVIQADQKAYKINFWINFFKIAETAVEIGLIYLKLNYVIILIPAIFIRFIANIVINRVVSKEYPWLTAVKNPNKSILKGTKDFLAYRICDIVYSNTDLLIISSTLDSIYVVIYSGYNYIVKTITEIINLIMQAIVPSLGNAINKESKEDSYQIFEEQNSLFAFFAMFFSVCVFALIEKFVVLWMGEDKILGMVALALLIGSLFHLIYQKVIVNIVEVKGWFKQTRNIAIAEAVTNVILSIILVQFLGVTGVILATIIATLCTKFWYYPVYVYKHQFERKPTKYYLNFFTDLAVTIVVSGLFFYVVNKFTVTNYFIWIILAAICAMIAGVVILGYKFAVSKDFRRLTQKVWYLVKTKILKKNNALEG